MGETSIGGYEVLGKLGDSKRFRAFQASSGGARRGTLYLMTDEVQDPDLFIDTAEAIRDAWPFGDGSQRDYVLPKAQLWEGRPWFFLPDLLPVVASVDVLGRAAFESLTAQLRWLEHFQPAGGERRFAHGDVRKERIALFDDEQALLIAPGWVAAADYARGQGLSRVRGDDVWHLGQLWIRASDHSFVPEGMEPELSEAVRRLPRSRPSPRVEARDSLRDGVTAPASAPAQPAASVVSSDSPLRSPVEPVAAAPSPAAPSPATPLAPAAKASNGARSTPVADRAAASPLAPTSPARPTPVVLASPGARPTPVALPVPATPAASPQLTTPAPPAASAASLPEAAPQRTPPTRPTAPAIPAAAKLATPATPPPKPPKLVAVPSPVAALPTPTPSPPPAPELVQPELERPVEAAVPLVASQAPESAPAPPAPARSTLKTILIAAALLIAVALAVAFFR